MGFRSGLKHYFSIRIRLNTSWYLATVLIAWVIGTGFSGNHELWVQAVFGLLGGTIFLISALTIQLVKNAAYILFNVPIRIVTLYVFGDSTTLPEDETRPGREVVRSVISLAFNLVAAAIFQSVYAYYSGTRLLFAVTIMQWLAFLWYIIAVLNLVPAFPLTAGRILFAAVWKATGNHLRAIQLATSLGRLFGLALMAWGLFLLFGSGQTTDGVLLTFFGWLFQGAASLNDRRAMLLDSLKYARARDIMHRDYSVASPGISVYELTQKMIISGQDYIPVVDQETFLGVVTPKNIKRLSKKKWASTDIDKIMTGRLHVLTASGDEPAAHVLETMDQFNIGDVPVTEDGRLIGVAARDDLERLARVRADLKI